MGELEAFRVFAGLRERPLAAYRLLYSADDPTRAPHSGRRWNGRQDTCARGLKGLRAVL